MGGGSGGMRVTAAHSACLLGADPFLFAGEVGRGGVYLGNTRCGTAMVDLS